MKRKRIFWMATLNLAFYDFCHTNWKKKNISRQYKILCQEERTTQQAISKKLNLQLKSLKFFLFFPWLCTQHERGRRKRREKKGWKRKLSCWHIWSVVFAVTVKCLVFLLIICETFLDIDRNPQMGNSIDWMWFGKVQTCLYKVSQLAMHIRVKTTSHEVEKLRTRTVQIHWIGEVYRNVLLQFRL